MRNQVLYVQIPQYHLHELLDDLGTYWTHKYTAVNAQVVVLDMVDRYRRKGLVELKAQGLREWRRGAMMRRGRGRRVA